MENNKKDPAALAGAHREKAKVSLRSFTTTPDHNFQADYIAAKFRIPPRLARVICELAQIGGRLI